jgi:hypothetical protein
MFFLDRDRNQNIFDWNPHPKFVSEGTGTNTLNFFSPGPGAGAGRNFFFSPGPRPKMTGPAHG